MVHEPWWWWFYSPWHWYQLTTFVHVQSVQSFCYLCCHVKHTDTYDQWDIIFVLVCCWLVTVCIARGVTINHCIVCTSVALPIMLYMVLYHCFYYFTIQLVTKVLIKDSGSDLYLFFRPFSGVLFFLAPYGYLIVISIVYSHISWPNEQASTRQPPLSIWLLSIGFSTALPPMAELILNSPLHFLSHLSQCWYK